MSLETGFFMPTKVKMGTDCVQNNAAELSSFGSKALIVTGARSAKLCGALDDVIAALSAQNKGYAVFDQVTANPTVSCVYAGATAAKTEGADFIIAIGGGSPMDAAKAIALLACQDIPPERLFAGGYGETLLPMVHIPTTAGTGSEVTPYSVLTNDSIQSKMSISCPGMFPRLALLDAKYTKALPRSIALNTAVDALSHAMEGILSKRASVFSDILANESAALIVGCFDALKTGELTDQVRERLLYASMLAGVVISHTGTTAVHALGYSLTYFKDVDHGRANGLLLAAFLRHVGHVMPALAEKALRSAGYPSVGEFDRALSDILGEKEAITPEQLELFSDIGARARSLTNCEVLLSREDVRRIYLESLMII